MILAKGNNFQFGSLFLLEWSCSFSDLKNQSGLSYNHSILIIFVLLECYSIFQLV